MNKLLLSLLFLFSITPKILMAQIYSERLGWEADERVMIVIFQSLAFPDRATYWLGSILV